jgi:hypothetical protein
VIAGSNGAGEHSTASTDAEVRQRDHYRRPVPGEGIVRLSPIAQVAAAETGSGQTGVSGNVDSE